MSAALSGFILNSQFAYASAFTDSGASLTAWIRSGHFSGDRRVDVRGGLHRLDDRARFALRQLAACCRQLDEDQVAQLFLRVVGDADGDGAVGFAPDPFVRFGVLEIRPVYSFACAHGSLFGLVAWRLVRV
jgi:hypothetical protein